MVDTAYADDLLTYASSPEQLQVKAELMSSYAAVFGFNLATSKIRTFSTGAPTTLTIYNQQWEPTVLEVTDNFLS